MRTLNIINLHLCLLWCFAWQAYCAVIFPPPPNMQVIPSSYIIGHNYGEGGLSTAINKQNAKCTPRIELPLIGSTSVTCDDEDNVHKLCKDGGIRSAYPVIKVEQTLRVFFADNFTGVAADQQKLGLTGKGIKVGVLDNGIDFHHPAFGNCFKTPGCKIQFGFDFIGNGTPENPQPNPVPFEPCNGHGTHVAGIIAADDPIKHFTGVAPKATLGIYRVSNCDAGTSNDIIIQAMQQAKNDGMDIINLSIGHDFASWPEDPLAVAASKLSDSGIAVCVAASNQGNVGLFSLGSPDSGANVITVGSVENSKSFFFFLTSSADPSKKIIYATTRVTLYFGLPGPLPFKPSSDQPLTPDDACGPVNRSFEGELALIARGGCSFTQKLQNAENAGAVGVIFYNNNPDQPDEISVATDIPSAFISEADGLSLLKQYNQNPDHVFLTFPNQTITVEVQTAAQPLNNSGFGPTFTLDLKPDFLAPGGQIFSTFPIALGSYATLSGTSMAAAYMSGSVALFLQARGKTDPKRIRDIFQTTSRPLLMKNLQQQSLGMIHTTAKQGGGLINAFDAVKSELLITPGKLALNDTPHFNGTASFKIENHSKNTKNYVLFHEPAASARGFFGGFLVPLANTLFDPFYAKVQINPSSISLAPGKSIIIKLKITPPSQLNPEDFGIYSGFIVIKNADKNSKGHKNIDRNDRNNRGNRGYKNINKDDMDDMDDMDGIDGINDIDNRGHKNTNRNNRGHKRISKYHKRNLFNSNKKLFEFPAHFDKNQKHTNGNQKHTNKHTNGNHKHTNGNHKHTNGNHKHNNRSNGGNNDKSNGGNNDGINDGINDGNHKHNKSANENYKNNNDTKTFLAADGIDLRDNDPNEEFSVPYLGLKGDLSTFPVLGLDPATDSPFIIDNSNGNQFFGENETVQFDFAGDDFPTLIYTMILGSPLVKAILVVEHTNDFVGTIFQMEFVRRNDFFGGDVSFFNWDGTVLMDNSTMPTTVPNGSYQIILEALHINGNPKNQNDFMTWRSPIIVIKRGTNATLAKNAPLNKNATSASKNVPLANNVTNASMGRKEAVAIE
ncbi:subtilisin-like protein [Gigaspora margarita]|uniref:Subtilisin-like protein n=1 Tax=Gigaspora margarita TaxID=4874 RepID=A0A8H3X3H7_GIGMA|nr:subtilisin-like protein [Gigaspora margarita]